jgi:hypothetical protein
MRIAPKTAALSLLAATQFVLVLDASIVNVALPSIGRDLGVAPGDRRPGDRSRPSEESQHERV